MAKSEAWCEGWPGSRSCPGKCEAMTCEGEADAECGGADRVCIALAVRKR